jgi:hypothetical protein
MLTQAETQYLAAEQTLLARRLDVTILTDSDDTLLVEQLRTFWRQIPRPRQRQLDNAFSDRLLRHLRQQIPGKTNQEVPVSKNQLPMFRNTDFTDTSAAAKASLPEDKLSKLRRQVYRYAQVRGYRGTTCWEVEQGLKLSHQTASARCTELHQSGLIVDSGQRRPTGSGRKAIVWVAAHPAAKA